MSSLMGLFYKPPGMPAAPTSIAPTDEATPEALRESMRRDFEALLWHAAPVYAELSPADRKTFLEAWLTLQERMDQAHREGASAEFHAALVEAKALLAEVRGAIIGKS